ncbi:MAG: hypothetical protein ONB16_08885 [candidate division KSB1 bacterium]|nr:hypothetical protein [candidate division KSB1 bacterium]MDZ7342716.1 hypothetical protein [candidate division KSB1 bacterium]
MKSACFSLLALLVWLVNAGFTDSNAPTSDMFGLKMEVIAPFPDLIDDDIEMDTVVYKSKVSVIIFYKNLSGSTINDFEITAFFPNRLESYSKLIAWDRTPNYVDPDSSIQAQWKIGRLNSADSGRIEFSLHFNRASEDTIYLSYEIAAGAQGKHVSQISHTNIYVPMGGGIIPYPNLAISKTDGVDQVYPGDIITYNIRYQNVETRQCTPATRVVIADTLPAHFTFLDASSDPIQETLPDGRVLLRWNLQHHVPTGYSGTVQFRVRVDLIAYGDTLVYNTCRITSAIEEIDLTNNTFREPVLVVPKIDLAIYQIGPPEYTMVRDENREFIIRGHNFSLLDLKNVNINVKIDDGNSGSNIYAITDYSGGGNNTNDESILWTVPLLKAQDSVEYKLRILINHLDKTQDYAIHFSARIDTAILLADRAHDDINPSNNHAEWVVNVDGTPNLAVKIEADQATAMTNDTRAFKLTCTNLSVAILDSVDVRAYIQDGESGFNYYTLTSSLSEQDGRPNADTTMLSWRIPPLKNNESLNISFTLRYDKIGRPYRDYPNFAIMATIDSVETEAAELGDNISQCTLFIDGTPNLAVDITEASGRTGFGPNGTANFKLKCQNLSSPITAPVDLSVVIEGQNIFTLGQFADAIIMNNQRITWPLPALDFNQAIERNFNLTFDKIEQAGNYSIRLLASVDTVEVNPQEFSNNRDQWELSVSAAPIVTLGPINLTPQRPLLRNVIQYVIPYGNQGNFTAPNAVMTIELPACTFARSYLHQTAYYAFSDSTISTFQVPLGDLRPEAQGSVVVNLRIYAFKQLPSNLKPPLPLNFKAYITFDGGRVDAARTDNVDFPLPITKLTLDKNIAPSDQMPVQVIFTSGEFGDLAVKVYNLAGEFIATVYQGPVDRGDTYTFFWNGLNDAGTPVASGVYFVYATAKFYNGYKKVIIVK